MSNTEYAHDIDGDITPMTDINLDLDRIIKKHCDWDNVGTRASPNDIKACMTAAIRADRGRVKKVLEESKEALQTWLDMSDCDCLGYGHTCGRTQRERQVEEIQTLLDDI